MFVKRMNEKEEAAFYLFAQDVTKLLDGFDWFAHHGTMLGAYRHAEVIPWDDDFDLAFPESKWMELKNKLDELGWKFQMMRQPKPQKIELALDAIDSKNRWDFCQIWNPSFSFHKRKTISWPYFDLAFYKECGDMIGFEHGHGTGFAWIKKDKIFPTKLYPFGPMSLRLPKNTTLLLNMLYPKWKTNPTSAKLCHRTGLKYPEPVESMSIEELRKKGFKFYNIDKEENLCLSKE